MLLLRNGQQAFAAILRRIEAARRSVRMRCFDWRDDETGAMFGRALLAAAERGVSITVQKDRVGANYEYLEGSQQSFLHKEMDLLAKAQTLFLMAVYDRWGSLRQRPNPLAAALCAHPNVRIEAGDRVPADGALIEAEGVMVDESVLTGESAPIDMARRRWRWAWIKTPA